MATRPTVTSAAGSPVPRVRSSTTTMNARSDAGRNRSQSATRTSVRHVRIVRPARGRRRQPTFRGDKQLRGPAAAVVRSFAINLCAVRSVVAATSNTVAAAAPGATWVMSSPATSNAQGCHGVMEGQEAARILVSRRCDGRQSLTLGHPGPCLDWPKRSDLRGCV